MATKFKGQHQWISEVLNAFEAVEGLQPKPLRDLASDWPVWAINLMVMLTAVSHPGLKVKAAKKWKAKDLGKFLGRQYALAELERGEVPLSPAVQAEAMAGLVRMAEQAQKKNPSLNMKRLVKELQPEMKVWRAAHKRCMQDALASACARPYQEAAAFFEAFGKAIVIKPDDLRTERTVGLGDRICWTILLMWPQIERLESVAQLHRILEQAVKPHGVVIKYKRIEKLCQRIKLKFKAPGRPAGSKNSDKSPRALGVI